MMRTGILIFIISFWVSLSGISAAGAPTGHPVRGRVLEESSMLPIAGAVVKIGSDYLWTTTDIDGEFAFSNVYPGEYEIEASCLGYVSVTLTADVRAIQ
jgi:hypothetical protein